ncbi:MAG TPA: SDR family oxidoreductase [Intrasporangium sp.]|uniref:SDR family oxidoreductase n=1 Tax=Intrasporangium sp. TaxID=1925024 RepID=UPI002D76F02F|nr:SDR family oxidoreductase [Intrasporangium sp.]HET7398732.1 SDR family oxidoreductase [Intrasporangium sp.]
MTSLRVLFLGGTGIISTACVARAVADGLDVTLLNRGRTAATGRAPAPEQAQVLYADVRDPASVQAALGDRTFDVVVSFLGFTPQHVQADIDRFSGRVGQYVFISSASAYQTPPTHLPVTESTPLRNPHWQYSRDKIACEDLLVRAYRDTGFPVTIVRPSHTYDPTMAPFDGGWTVVERMRQGREVLVPGDGTSLWTLTHHEDFAPALVGLLGRQAAIGEAFHITSDEALTWNQIYTTMAHAAGAEPRLVHVPSDAVAAADPDLGASLLGDKANSMVFDNTKIRSLVPGWHARIPFSHGARQIIAWHDADPARRTVDQRLDALFDDLIDRYRATARR